MPNNVGGHYAPGDREKIEEKRRREYWELVCNGLSIRAHCAGCGKFRLMEPISGFDIACAECAAIINRAAEIGA